MLNADQRRRLALDILRQVPCLMIWDNFEPVAGFPKGTLSAWKPEEQKELRDFLSELRGGKTKMLITSRRDEAWLGKIYRRVELRGLKLVESQELTIRVLKRAGLNPQQINALPQYNDLLKYLSGNPLAIQVIIPELKRMEPDALLAALKADEVKLSEDDPSQGRERSLTASLRYRLDALDVMLCQRLGLLGMFQGFVNISVLASMCSKDDAPELIHRLKQDDWIRMLNIATEMGLLRYMVEGSYTVHPLLSWFFHDLLRKAFPSHLEWLECAFSNVYSVLGLQLFQMFQTNAPLAISLLRAEENNLMYALGLARQHECWDNVKWILCGLNQLLTTQGRWVEWERLITDVEAEVTDAGGEPLIGREDLWIALLGHRAGIAHYHRDFDSEQYIESCLRDHYEHVGDDRNQAVALLKLGMIAHKRRQIEEAEQWYRQSLDIANRIFNEHLQAIILHNLGIIAQKRRQFDKAERWYRQSLAIEERIGDEHGKAQTLHQLGMIAQGRQQVKEAKHLYQQSLAIKKRIGDKQGQAQTLGQLGNLAQLQRQFEEAERWHRQALIIFDCVGDEHGQAQTFHQLGLIAEGRNNAAEAVRFYEQAKVFFELLNDPHSLEIVRRSLQRVQGIG